MSETYSPADQHDGIDPDMADAAETPALISFTRCPNPRFSPPGNVFK